MDEQERLTQRVKDLQRLQDQDRERRKVKPNIRMDEDLPDRLPAYDFWCDNCQEDFTVPCYKTRHRLYGYSVAIYRGKCPICEEESTRNVTHRDEDNYYNKSTKIRHQRNKYAWHTLQADQTGFRTHYGIPFNEFEEKMKDKEERLIKIERDKGIRGTSLEVQQRLRKLYRA